jgi:hypothetical protein
MIGPSGAVRVMVATRPVDFRKGAEGLRGGRYRGSEFARVNSFRPPGSMIGSSKRVDQGTNGSPSRRRAACSS